MEQVTVEQLKKHVQDNGVSQWKLRSCGFCGTGLHYTFYPDHVTYNSNCACTDRWTPVESRDYSEPVRTLNMQTPENRERMWNEIAAAGNNDKEGN